MSSAWCLFLDRDGVINKKLDGDYVKSLGEFEWIENAPECVARLSHLMQHTFVVTNQQGIGKGIMRHEDLHIIHKYLADKIIDLGGTLDGIYYAPQLATENSPMRKPNTGMAIQAKKDFLHVDFSKSVMVGDSDSDMQFGQRLGMHCIYIHPNKSVKTTAQAVFDSLPDAEAYITQLVLG